MAQAGMSTRAIGAAVGVDHKTVVNDHTASTGENSPVAGTVLSLDGRKRPSTRPAPEPGPFDGSDWTEPDDDAEPETATPTPAPAEPAKAKRRPLPEAIADAGRDLARAAERLGRLADDDRFTRNRDQTHHQMPELLGALDHTARLIQAMNLPAAGASEETRRWWATSLHTLSDTLRGVAHSLNQEQK